MAGIPGIGADLAGDEVSGDQFVEILSKKLGHQVTYYELPTEKLREFSVESAIMFDWFNEVGYSVDIQSLRKQKPDLKTFEQWMDQIGVNLKRAA